MFSLIQMIAYIIISFLGGMLSFMIGLVCIVEIRSVKKKKQRPRLRKKRQSP